MNTRRSLHLRRTAPGTARCVPRTPFEIGRSDRTPAVIYKAVECYWWLWWPCETCDGTQLPLRGSGGSSSLRRPLADRIAGQPCPSCETRRQRLAPDTAEPAVWYDTSLNDWVLLLPWRGSHGGVLLPLEIRWFDAPWADVYRAAADIAYSDDPFHDAR